LAHFLFSLLFFWVFWINYTTVRENPELNLNYATLTPVNLYQDFINGWFKSNTIFMVTFISLVQGLIAFGLLLKGWIVRLSCFGAIVFFIAILPLGIGAGFPATLFTAIAIYFILKNDDLSLLWDFFKK